jgi:O-acetyl-ADP-ribose deacetylase (regulator of RNase III)
MAPLSFEPLNQAIGKTMKPVIVYGNLLDQDVQVIVNAWNRNIIPWWLLLPQGVSGAIKKKGGIRPFMELSKHGPVPLGQAVLTGAGRLPFEGIIHVAGINMLWHASERSIRGSVQSAMDIVDQHGFRSVAFPIIGAGSGRFKTDKALELMLDEFLHIKSGSVATIVKYRKT